MKPPLAPEPVATLLPRHSDNLASILQSWKSPTVGGRYLHWDELRHRPAPEGLSNEQWWLAIKLARSSQYRALPLADLNERPLVFMLPDLVQEALHRIDSRMSGLKAANLPDEQDRFIINSLIHEAIASSRLEGASTTQANGVEMLRSGRRPRDRSERMIANNYRAMQAVRHMADQPLSRDGLLELHAMITRETLDDPADAGRLQQPGDERVHVSDVTGGKVLHRPPPAKELPVRVQRMIRFANQEDEDQAFIHPIVRAIALHFWLAYDHPFADGNGRTARALFYWSALRSNYRLFEFISISWHMAYAPTRYARSFLHTETDGADLTYFLAHQAVLLLRAINGVEQYIAEKTEQCEAVENMLTHSTGFNHRQLALLAHALKHPSTRYSVRSHRTSHNVANGTARSDLLELAKWGLLERKRSDGRSYAYLAPADLEPRIRGLADDGV